MAAVIATRATIIENSPFASFGVFGIAALVLTPVIPAMIALAGAMTLLGIASVGVGAGILALSVGLGYLSTVSVSGINSVIQIFKKHNRIDPVYS